MNSTIFIIIAAIMSYLAAVIWKKTKREIMLGMIVTYKTFNWALFFLLLCIWAMLCLFLMKYNIL